LGVRLFDRLPNGVALTTEGESILDAARHIENTVLEIQRNVHGSDKRMEGTVRISVTDGLATYWLTPQLSRLQERHPGISIEFQCSIEPADALKMETDLSIRYQRPEAADLIAMKLGTLHFVPWASPDYVERNGAPTTPEELLRHRLLDHRSYDRDREFGVWNDWFALAHVANLISYVTNSSASMLSAIQSGLGIGMLPTYVCECVEGIVPLSLDLHTSSEIWLTYHPNIQGTARVREVIDWTKTVFDHRTWPWFRDEFHPPKVPPNKPRSIAQAS
jgi:DNA-binding transcriptional LysR family regulator